MRTEKYTTQQKRLPQSGKQIIAQTENSNIVVYQAFNKNIANYAVANQQFGGNHYSFNRMSWIKPGFLWMMHCAGWATKEQQEHILAITISIEHFKTILKQATISSFNGKLFNSTENWKAELDKTEVRLQWDPDHDPYGIKQERKAIQLGMKGNLLKQFCTKWIIRIEDITPFVKEEYFKIKEQNIEDLNVPLEEIIPINDVEIIKRIGLNNEL